MDLRSSLMQRNTAIQRTDVHSLLLQGRGLLFARAISIVLVLVAFGLFLAAIPLRYQ